MTHNQRKEKQRLLMRRFRLEQKRLSTKGLPVRVRAPKVPRARRERLKNDGAIFYFDDLGAPVQGDALERLKAIR